MNEVEYYKDKDLMKRWKCSGMKLWRMRRDGKLNSIQIGDCGPWLTSAAEIARIEAPPDIKQRPAPKGATEGNGPKANEVIKHPLDSEPAAPAQVSMNGGGE